MCGTCQALSHVPGKNSRHTVPGGADIYLSNKIDFSVNVVQSARLQTLNLQKNQINKTGEAAQWRFGRPFFWATGSQIRWKLLAHTTTPGLPNCEVLGSLTA
jgi:hypothetical protein